MSVVHLTLPATTVINCSQPPVQETSTSTAAASTPVDAPSTSSASGFSMSSYLLDSQVSRAEIKYCLKIVKSHASMHSADDSRKLFRATFPDQRWQRNFCWEGQRHRTLLTTGWLPGVFLVNMKQRLLTIALNSISIFVACPYWKSRGI